MGLTHVLTAIGLALAAAVSSGDSSQHALLAQPTCTIDVPWEDELAAQRDCKWAKCHLCWKSVWYIKETHVLPNITIGTVAKGTHLTCSWLSHARNDTTCAAITDAVPSIVVNLTAGHRVGDVCRSLALCKSRKPQKPRKMSKGIGSICTHCYYGVKYVNATRHITGLPEKAVKIGVQVLCPHCPHYRKACHKFVRSVPTILKELETGKTCAKAICKDVGFCGRKHRAHGERPTPDDDDADDMSLDEDADDEEVDLGHHACKRHGRRHDHQTARCAGKCRHCRPYNDGDDAEDDGDGMDDEIDTWYSHHGRHCHGRYRRHYSHDTNEGELDEAYEDIASETTHVYHGGSTCHGPRHGRCHHHCRHHRHHHHHHHHHHQHHHHHDDDVGEVGWAEGQAKHLSIVKAAHFSKVTSIVAAGVVTVGIVFLTAKVFQRRRVQGVEAEYVAVPQQGR